MIIGETEKNNMVFSSLNFMFVFLPIVFGIYFISPRKIRNFILFIASLVFYAWGEPFYVVLMLFSTILCTVLWCKSTKAKRPQNGF